MRLAALTSDYSASPLAQVFEDVYETYKRQTGGSGPPRNLTPLERTAQTRCEHSDNRSGAAHDVAGDDRLRRARLWACSGR